MSLDVRAQKLIAQYQQQQELYKNLARERVLLETEIKELEKVLDEIKKLPDDAELYYNMGHVMYKTTKEEAIRKIDTRLELLKIKLESVKKHESLIRSELEKLAEELKKYVGGAQVGAGGG